jgi:hypothetical protein
MGHDGAPIYRGTDGGHSPNSLSILLAETSLTAYMDYQCLASEDELTRNRTLKRLLRHAHGSLGFLSTVRIHLRLRLLLTALELSVSPGQGGSHWPLPFRTVQPLQHARTHKMHGRWRGC